MIVDDMRIRCIVNGEENVEGELVQTSRVSPILIVLIKYFRSIRQLRRFNSRNSYGTKFAGTNDYMYK